MTFSGKYIAKMFDLKKFLVCKSFSHWFVSVRVVGSQRHVSRKGIRWKIFEQIGIGMAYLHVFLITMHEIDTAAEV